MRKKLTKTDIARTLEACVGRTKKDTYRGFMTQENLCDVVGIGDAKAKEVLSGLEPIRIGKTRLYLCTDVAERLLDYRDIII